MANRVQLRTFGFAQYLNADYWLWSDDEKDKYFKDAETILNHICYRLYEGLKKAGAQGVDLKFEFAGISHDKDTKILFDERKNAEVIEPVDEHVHAVVTLSKKRDLNVIAEWVGLEPQFVEKPKKGPYGKENMLAYLIHAKQPDKYQYSPDEVKTFGTFDYKAYWSSKKPDWDRRKATVQTKNNKVTADWLAKQVQYGLLSKKDIMAHDDYKYVYADNMQLINDAFQFYGEMKGFETLEALENGEFELSVIFITGAPGSGKTHFALDQVKRLEKELGWRSYQAASTNPMDDYNGEEIVLLDDLRAQSLDATAWLQMLDARTSSNISARYKNKQKAYRTLVITSYLEPYEFFSYIKGTGGANEALDQFIRRIMLNVRVHRLYDSGRYVELEAIGMTNEVVYDLENGCFVPPHDNVDLYSNGLPVLDSNNEYAENQISATKNDLAYKLLSHAGYPLFAGESEKAGEFLRNIVEAKNDPNYDHSKSERPQVGNEMAFLNEHPEIAKAMKIGKYKED